MPRAGVPQDHSGTKMAVFVGGYLRRMRFRSTGALGWYQDVVNGPTGALGRDANIVLEPREIGRLIVKLIDNPATYRAIQFALENQFVDPIYEELTTIIDGDPDVPIEKLLKAKGLR